MKNQLFKDLKVIELASVLAGPAVGLFFAELGAKVIKIENQKTGGDVTRTWKLAKEDKEAPVSAYYASINWNKEVLFLDLRQDTHREQVYELIREADIVVVNYKTDSAQRLGMDYARLKQLNPQLIYANISGFGSESTRVAFDVVLQAESGFMYMNGQPESPATKMPVALIDILAAHHLKQGVLVALLERYKTGKGKYVEVSLFDAAVASLANQASNWLMAEHIPERIGSLHPNIAPYGEIFKTADDKQLVLAIGTHKQFSRLCHILNIPDLAENDAYNTNVARVKNRLALQTALQTAFSALKAEDILNQCHEQAVPIATIRDMKAVFELRQAQNLVLKEQLTPEFETKRVRTAIFRIED
ncbi:MAG: CoA transferase [Saprospiraceae bacterium]|nr:CoA transferase [Saprospiraceae bacterium]